MTKHTSTLLFVVAAFLATGHAVAGPRILVVEAEESGAAATALLRGREGFEVRRRGAPSLDRTAVAWADVFALTDPRLGDEEAALTLLSAAVHRGKGLVVAGESAAVVGAAALRARLWPPLAAVGEATEPDLSATSLSVMVLDQSHRVTQCVTDFEHRVFHADWEMGEAASVLAATPVKEKPSRSVPVVWTARAGRGGVLVTGLDLVGGKSPGMARAVLVRGVEWLARLPVSARLEGPFLLASERWARTLAEDRSRVIDRWASRPGFYLGREIAPVMSYHGADWLLREDREKTEQPGKVLDALKIARGATVADLGAGNGYFSLRLARRVGSSGKVLAVEIQKEMLRLLEKRAADEGIENIESVLAVEDDPRLPAAAVDLVLMVDVYHELSKPATVMRALYDSLRPDGRVALVEYRGEDPGVPIKPRHRMLLPQIVAELTAAGLELLDVEEFLPYQRIVIAGKKASSGE